MNDTKPTGGRTQPNRIMTTNKTDTEIDATLDPTTASVLPSQLCPACKSWDIVGSGYDVAGLEISQNMTCQVCDKVWVDVYHFSQRRV